MRDLSTGGYTDEAVRKALFFDGGSREISFRLELLNSVNQRLGDLTFRPGGQIAMNGEAQIKRTASFLIAETEFADIDWMSNRIRPWLRLKMPGGGWAEWPLGVYLISSPRRAVKNYAGWQYEAREVAAYDASLVLAEDKFPERHMIPAGTPYIEAMSDIIQGAGVKTVNFEHTSAELTTDREFEMGASRLDAVEALLQELNYGSLYADEKGMLTAIRYIPAARRTVDHRYKTDRCSVICPDVGIDLDAFGSPNVYVCVVSNPETGELKSVYVNDLSTSPLSTVRRGRRIVAVETVDNIASQGELDGYAERLAEQGMQVYQNTTVPTAILPGHSVGDVVEMDHTLLGSARYLETAWTMPLQAGGIMQHVLRKVVQM